MDLARQLAARLRDGQVLSHCDSTLTFSDGTFCETSMGYDGRSGHMFSSTRPSFLQVKRWLKSGAYR